jgi:hypothetical protein
MTTPEIHSASWFDDAFKTKTPVPEALRVAATRVCKQYNIRGICDPLYIANCLAFELGAGDGESNFVPGPVRASSSQVEKLADFLKHAYSSCIQAPKEEVKALLQSALRGFGPLPPEYPELVL